MAGARVSALKKNLLPILGIVLLGIALYAHTLHVPWYLDDTRVIVENPSVHRLETALAELFAQRGFATLTFALNYALGGTEVVGYHLVNIAIHLLTSCLVFLLLKRVFRERLLPALGGALIFVAHPLQTQAVTYIVQRMTSLAALFFFLALYMFVRFRESADSGPGLRLAYYGGALLCSALAVLIKQNTAVLPVAIFLFDRYFLDPRQPLPWKRAAGYAAPFLLIPAGLAVQTLLLPIISGEGIAELGGMPDLVHLRHSSPLNYLVTEFSVIWIYLRLLFFPFGQALDYDVPIVASIWSLKNLIAFAGVAALFAAAVYLRRKWPIVSAGILWFFLGLAVESTIIPLDPVFEHRLYIPMFGFALVVMAAIDRLPRKAAVATIVVLIGALTALTWMRNDLWNDPIAFHADNLRQAPSSERVHLDLANAYRRAGRMDEAKALYERALEINPDYVLLHINLSIIYTAQKDYQKAVNILIDGLRSNPSHFKLHNNVGVLYNYLGNYQEAASHLQKAIMLDQSNAMVHFNLALAYDRLGRLDEAVTHFRRAIALNHDHPESHFNLGLTLHRKDRLQEALDAFLVASRLNPEHPGSLYNASLVAIALGDKITARRLAAQLQHLDSDMAQEILFRLH